MFCKTFRWAAAALAVLSLGLLLACGGNSNEEGSQSNEEESQPTLPLGGEDPYSSPQASLQNADALGITRGRVETSSPLARRASATGTRTLARRTASTFAPRRQWVSNDPGYRFARGELVQLLSGEQGEEDQVEEVFSDVPDVFVKTINGNSRYVLVAGDFVLIRDGHGAPFANCHLVGIPRPTEAGQPANGSIECLGRGGPVGDDYFASGVGRAQQVDDPYFYFGTRGQDYAGRGVWRWDSSNPATPAVRIYPLPLLRTSDGQPADESLYPHNAGSIWDVLVFRQGSNTRHVMHIDKQANSNAESAQFVRYTDGGTARTTAGVSFPVNLRVPGSTNDNVGNNPVSYPRYSWMQAGRYVLTTHSSDVNDAATRQLLRFDLTNTNAPTQINDADITGGTASQCTTSLTPLFPVYGPPSAYEGSSVVANGTTLPYLFEPIIHRGRKLVVWASGDKKNLCYMNNSGTVGRLANTELTGSEEYMGGVLYHRGRRSVAFFAIRNPGSSRDALRIVNLSGTHPVTPAVISPPANGATSVADLAAYPRGVVVEDNSNGRFFYRVGRSAQNQALTVTLRPANAPPSEDDVSGVMGHMVDLSEGADMP